MFNKLRNLYINIVRFTGHVGHKASRGLIKAR
jgi:hypothetical protein